MKHKKIDLKESIAWQENTIVSKEIVKNQSGRIVTFAFSSGEELSEHTSPFDAFVTILDGAATIFIEGEPHDLESGQAILMPANIPHAVKSRGNFKMMLCMLKE